MVDYGRELNIRLIGLVYPIVKGFKPFLKIFTELFGNMKKISYLSIIHTQKVEISLNLNKKMVNQMTRKEAATILKKYEVNGMIGIHFKSKPAPKQEYFEAKQRWNEIVKEQRN